MLGHRPSRCMPVIDMQRSLVDDTDQQGGRRVDPATQHLDLAEPHDGVLAVGGRDTCGKQAVQRRVGLIDGDCCSRQEHLRTHVPIVKNACDNEARQDWVDQSPSVPAEHHLTHRNDVLAVKNQATQWRIARVRRWCRIRGGVERSHRRPRRVTWRGCRCAPRGHRVPRRASRCR